MPEDLTLELSWRYVDFIIEQLLQFYNGFHLQVAIPNPPIQSAGNPGQPFRDEKKALLGEGYGNSAVSGIGPDSVEVQVDILSLWRPAARFSCRF